MIDFLTGQQTVDGGKKHTSSVRKEVTQKDHSKRSIIQKFSGKNLNK